jgi:hypothetical protein
MKGNAPFLTKKKRVKGKGRRGLRFMDCKSANLSRYFLAMIQMAWISPGIYPRMVSRILIQK